MVAYLEKSEGSEGFHQIIDFLSVSHIQYALTENPMIYVSFIKQFWKTATASTSANREVELTATIDGQVKTITEASLRRYLKLEDNSTLSNTEIFEQLALMGYVTDSEKLTFQKGYFSPQWRFLIHTILHSLSLKKTAWEQFSSNIATAIICLATNRTFNFSKMIFDAMVKNLDNTHKFLMYPRFIQICLNMQKRLLQPYTRTYIAHSLTHKVFSNMKRTSRGYTGEDFPLYPTIITAPETSPSRITSSPSLSPEPSLSPQHTPFTAPSTSQLSNIKTTSVTEEAASMPYESPLQSVHSLRCDEGSLSLYELTVLCTNLSNKGRSLIEELDLDAEISLVPPHDAEIQEKNSVDTEILLEEEKSTELVEDFGSGEKGEKEVTTAEPSTVDIPVNTAIAIPAKIITARQVYIRRSAEKRKVKGKVIIKDNEPVQKNTKKQLEQERIGLEEAIRLQEQIDEEERKRIVRDAKIARQLHEEINIAEQEVVAEADQAQVIDWNDPVVIRFHAHQTRPFSVAEVRKNMCIYLKNQGGYKMSYFKGMKYEDIIPIFERVWDQNHSFVPKDSEIEKEVMKRPGFNLQQESVKKDEASSFAQKQSSKGRRKKILAKKRAVPEEGMNVKALQTKYPLIDWEIYTEDSRVY
ncbi:hypothetical protein Tco_1120669 [Tanacetum coccineum]